MGSPVPVHAPGPLGPSTLHKICVYPCWLADGACNFRNPVLAALSFPITTNLSRAAFVNVLRRSRPSPGSAGLGSRDQCSFGYDTVKLGLLRKCWAPRQSRYVRISKLDSDQTRTRRKDKWETARPTSHTSRIVLCSRFQQLCYMPMLFESQAEISANDSMGDWPPTTKPMSSYFHGTVLRSPRNSPSTKYDALLYTYTRLLGTKGHPIPKTVTNSTCQNRKIIAKHLVNDKVPNVDNKDETVQL